MIGGCFILIFVIEPLHLFSADFITMFIANGKRVAGIVQPVVMPLSNVCQFDMLIPVQILILKLL